MQAENQNFSDFSRRTEILAEKLGVRLVDLPTHLGISKAMLFAYRKGGYTISGKAWRKLEQAERAAGLLAPEDREALEDLPEKVQGAFSTMYFSRLHKLIFEFIDDAEALGIEILKNKSSPQGLRAQALDITGRSGAVKHEWAQTFEALRIIKKK